MTSAPFDLCIHLLEAKNVPIADITTSDPYVTIYLDDKLMGRSKTVFRNCNPTWGEFFRTPILHRNHTIEFRLYDEDQGKDPDFLGSLALDLVNFPVSKSYDPKSYEVKLAAKYRGKAATTLEVSIIVGRRESLIAMIPMENTTSEAPSTTDVLSMVKCQEGWGVASDAVQATFQDLVQEGVLHAGHGPGHFSGATIKDLLYDVVSILHESPVTEAGCDYGTYAYHREKLTLRNASVIDLETGEVRRHPPIEHHSALLHIISPEGKHSTLALVFQHRYALWVFMAWMQVADRVWSRRLKKHYLTQWMREPLNLPMIVRTSNPVREIQGRGVLDIERPYVLQLPSDSVSFQGVRNVVIGADSIPPSPHKLVLSLLDLRVTGDNSEDAIREVEQPHHETEDAGKPHKSRGSFIGNAIGSTIRGAAKGIQVAVHTTTDVVKDTTNLAASTAVGAASMATSTAIGAVKTIASGDPLKIAKTMQEAVVEVGMDLATTITSAPGAVFGRNETFLLVRSRNGDETKLSLKTLVSNRIVVTPVDFVELEDMNEDEEANTGDHQLCQRLPTKNTLGKKETTVLEFTALQTLNTSFDRKPIAQSVRTLDSLLSLDGAVKSEPQTFHASLVLANNIAFSVKLLDVRDLAIPKDTRALFLFAKCKLVDANGQSGSTDFVEDFTTPKVAVSANPNFNHHRFVVKPQSSYDKSAFVRIEFYLEFVAMRLSIGAVFIPLDYFDTEVATYTFPVTHYRTQADEAPTTHSLGYLTATIRRKEQHEKLRNVIVTLAGKVQESGLFEDTWFAECALSGASEAEHVTTEHVSVSALCNGLRLIELGTENAARDQLAHQNAADLERMRSRASTDSTRLTSVHRLASTDADSLPASSTFRPKEFVIEVFENQRRQPYPPFDWSSSAITRPKFSDVDYAVGYSFDSIEDARPPEGFEWAGNWEVDKAPCGANSTDANGWMYGFTFGKILENYKIKRTHTKPFNTHARRKRLVRRVKALGYEGNDMTIRDVMITFEAANGRGAARNASTKTPTLPSNKSAHGADAMNNSSSAHGQSSHGSSFSHSSSNNTNAVSNNDWRRKRAEAGSILFACEEKSSEDGSIVIAWDQVFYAEVVSSSVLLVGFRIHRYIGDVRKGFTYRPSDMHMFVSNCPAFELKSLIDERKLLSKTRVNLRKLMDSNTVDCVVAGEGSSFDGVRIDGGGRLSDLEGTGEEDDEDTRQIEAERVPETEELSLGSEIASDLDNQISSIRLFIGRLQRQEAEGMDKRAEIHVLTRRLCRVRLYLAALYGLGLQSAHEFTEDAVRDIMTKDFRFINNITLQNEVLTANNRIEYLLDMAEKRIRDVALCGWKTPGELRRCAELFANGYLSEIMNVLGAFFEDKALNEIKGLEGKIELIRTYMKHNDRLDRIIGSAFRPYRLRASPPARLSLCLDFDLLITWYTTALNSEMRTRVDNAILVWKNPENRQESNVASLYKSEVPWIPFQREVGRQIFYSRIPGDLVDFLQAYLLYARIRREQVELTYKAAISRLDAKVCLAYSNSFLYLAECYSKELQLQHWSAIASNDEDLEEFLTWIASVANDAQLTVAQRLMHIEKAISHEDRVRNAIVEDAESLLLCYRCRTVFYKVQELALQQFAGVLLSFVFRDRVHWMTTPGSLAADFLKTCATDNAKVSADVSADSTEPESEGFFTSIVDQVLTVLGGFEHYLTESVLQSLLFVLANTVAGLFLWLVDDLWRSKRGFEVHDPVLKALAKEARQLSAALKEALGIDVLEEDTGDFAQKLPQMKYTLTLLTLLSPIFLEPIGGVALDTCLETLRETTLRFNASPFAAQESLAVVQAVERILGLRKMKTYSYKSGPSTSSRVIASANAVSSSMSSTLTHMISKGGGGGVSTPASSAPSTPAHDARTPPQPPHQQPQKRSSILGGLASTFFHHHATTSDAGHGAPPATPPPSSAHTNPAHPAISAKDIKNLSTNSFEDNEGDDDDDDEMAQLLAEKERAIVECIEVHLRPIREYQPTKSSTDSSAASAGDATDRPEDLLRLTASLLRQIPSLRDPFSRVFLSHQDMLGGGSSKTGSSKKSTSAVSLQTLLFYDNDETRNDQQNSPLFKDRSRSTSAGLQQHTSQDNNTSIVGGLTSMLLGSRIFGSSAASATAATPSGHHHVANTSQQRSLSHGNSWRHAAQLFVTLSDLHVTNLFYASNSIFGLREVAPKPYLLVRLYSAGHCFHALRTVALDGNSNAGHLNMGALEGTWTESLVLPVDDLSVSQVDVCISLCFDNGGHNDSVIGFVAWQFSPYDFPVGVTRRVMTIEKSDAAPHAVKVALKKLEFEGRNLPAIHFSWVCEKANDVATSSSSVDM